MAQTYYEVLGVVENASGQEIEAAFKSRAREVHPDRVGSSSAYLQKVAAEAFKELSEARLVLRDPAKRQKYDSALAHMRESPSASSVSSTPPPPSPQSLAPGRGQRKGTRTSPRPPVVQRQSNTTFAIIAFLIGVLGCVFFLDRPNSVPESGSTAPGASTRNLRKTNTHLSSALPKRNRDEARSSVADLSPVTAVTPKPVSDVAKLKGTEELRPRVDLSSDTRSRHTEANLQRPDLSDLSTDELLSIQAACSNALDLQGHAAYHRCLDQQLASLASAPRHPDLSSLSTDGLQSIQVACSNAKYSEGPAAYDRCLVRQLNLLANRKQ